MLSFFFEVGFSLPEKQEYIPEGRKATPKKPRRTNPKCEHLYSDQVTVQSGVGGPVFISIFPPVPLRIENLISRWSFELQKKPGKASLCIVKRLTSGRSQYFPYTLLAMVQVPFLKFLTKMPQIFVLSLSLSLFPLLGLSILERKSETDSSLEFYF